MVLGDLRSTWKAPYGEGPLRGRPLTGKARPLRPYGKAPYRGRPRPFTGKAPYGPTRKATCGEGPFGEGPLRGRPPRGRRGRPLTGKAPHGKAPYGEGLTGKALYGEGRKGRPLAVAGCSGGGALAGVRWRGCWPAPFRPLTGKAPYGEGP